MDDFCLSSYSRNPAQGLSRIAVGFGYIVTIYSRPSRASKMLTTRDVSYLLNLALELTLRELLRIPDRSIFAPRGSNLRLQVS